MPDLSLLYEQYGVDKTMNLLNRALEMTETNPSVTWIEIQNNLHVSNVASYVLIDWLADNFKTRPRISNHWIRCGRVYVMNNEETSLQEMSSRLNVGNRTAFCVMLELEKKGHIKIISDFRFERIKNGTTTSGFDRQIKRFAKKYRGRCEPELLMRTLYIDYDKAFKLAEHGRDNLGFVWRGKWKTKSKDYDIMSAPYLKELNNKNMSDKKILCAVKTVSDAIDSSLAGDTDNVYFIKESDLEEYISNSDLFTLKTFGDNLSGLSVNFIYKEGDQDLDQDFLNMKIKIALIKNSSKF